MSHTANMKEITTEEFEGTTVKKWADLEIGKVYALTHVRLVHTKTGRFIVLSLLKNGNVWTPEHLKKYYIMMTMSIQLFM